MERQRSPLWYYLPLFFLIVGGAIAYFKIKKDDPRKARNCLLVGILLTVPVAAILGIDFGFALTSGINNPFYEVSTGSMEPAFNIGDVLIVKDGSTFEKVKVGDIIVFNRPGVHDRVIVHRVVDIKESGERVLTTKGDANPASIHGTDFPITKDDYIGQVVDVIPKLGYVTKYIAPPVNYIISAVILSIPIIKHIRYRKSISRMD